MMDMTSLVIVLIVSCVLLAIMTYPILEDARDRFRFHLILRKAKRSAWVVDAIETGLHCGNCATIGSFHIETEDGSPLDIADAATVLDLIQRLDPKQRGTEFPPSWVGADGMCFKPLGIAKRHAKIVIRTGDGRLH